MHLTWILPIFASLHIWRQENIRRQKVERLVQLLDRLRLDVNAFPAYGIPIPRLSSFDGLDWRSIQTP
jgi:hypothetical protein